MPSLDLKNISMLILWIMPGFISIKVWSMLVATVRKKASEIIIECIIASFFNSIVYELIKQILNESVAVQTTWFIACIFILPVVWPFILRWILNTRRVSDTILDPVPKAWDKMFSRGEALYVIIHMKDGERIGGYYGGDSYVSSYPEIQDIYLEKVWKIKQPSKKELSSEGEDKLQKVKNGKKEKKEKNDDKEKNDKKETGVGLFEREIKGSKGLWVSKEDFKYIEFFAVKKKED